MHCQVYRIELVKDGRVPYDGASLSCSREAAKLGRAMLDGQDREAMIVVLLNGRNKPIGINTVSIGSLNMSVVHPREVFKPAIVGNASAIVLIHNHPSGDSSPSPEDIEITRRIQEGGRILGINVLDHVILGEDESYYSMRDEGRIGEIA